MESKQNQLQAKSRRFEKTSFCCPPFRCWIPPSAHHVSWDWSKARLGCLAICVAAKSYLAAKIKCLRMSSRVLRKLQGEKELEILHKEEEEEDELNFTSAKSKKKQKVAVNPFDLVSKIPDAGSINCTSCMRRLCCDVYVYSVSVLVKCRWWTISWRFSGWSRRRKSERNRWKCSRRETKFNRACWKTGCQKEEKEKEKERKGWNWKWENYQCECGNLQYKRCIFGGEFKNGLLDSEIQIWIFQKNAPKI